MQIRAASSASISEMMAFKQSAGERKFAGLRSLSEADRADLNERASDLCHQIASQFGKSKRFVPGARA